MPGSMMKETFLSVSRVGKRLPILHGKNCTEMTHRHLIAIDDIMCFVSGLIRA